MFALRTVAPAVLVLPCCLNAATLKLPALEEQAV
eukprot:CAMPEP_0115561788 /NCGR_PEP_ID=MMETSP0271-20121206/101163_1 /TAXON_ID=71861 /ORGANISM="Scrippsiella trochoidea, Strain CCMP3099" /LENGTH=33 /DNA_ID= /DNA_START= /DNA_END= /DNA_ORIENTATION=